VIRVVHISTIAPETLKDALSYIAENLRPDDRAELAATSAIPPEEAVLLSADVSSDAWLILDRANTPIGVFGVAPHVVPGVGVAWLLGTDGLLKEALSVARQTAQYVQELHRDYAVLWNYVDARNALSIRWLQWAGFTVGDVLLEHGPEARPFFMFVRHR